jgi:hypothetical protein
MEMTEVSVQKMVPAAMVSLREKVQAWRAKKKHRRMPEELWAEAVRLAREYGVHPVSKNVEVSYTRLKKLVDGKNEKCLARQSPPKFVQLSPTRSGSASGTRVEINRPDGCRLLVENADQHLASEVTAVFLGMRQ